MPMKFLIVLRVTILALCANNLWTQTTNEKSTQEVILDELMKSHTRLRNSSMAGVSITVLQEYEEDFKVTVYWDRRQADLQTIVEVGRTGECVACAMERLDQSVPGFQGRVVGELSNSVRSLTQVRGASELSSWTSVAIETLHASTRKMHDNIEGEIRRGEVEIVLDGSTYIVELYGSERRIRLMFQGPVLTVRRDSPMPEVAHLIEKALRTTAKSK